MRIYFNDEIEDVNVDDEVSTTTSTFDYDNVAGTFANDLNAYADVEIKYTHSDYSEYDPRTCRDGGDYGYDYYVVTKIHEVGELQTILEEFNMEIKQFLTEFKAYVGNFEYDLILLSDKRIAIINQNKNQFIEYHNDITMIDILECFCSSEISLKDFFGNITIKFSTDDYLKHYLSSSQQ